VVERLVLVNGLPGSGKTTLATPLAGALGAPLVAKDAIKEALADALPPTPSRTLGAAAMDVAWTVAAALDGAVVLEAWCWAPRDIGHVKAGLARCGSPSVVEVWCEVPPDLALRRYRARRRHPVHDNLALADSPEPWASGASPLGVGRVVRVWTDRPVDVAEVARAVSTVD
jgi:predicted kinase